LASPFLKVVLLQLLRRALDAISARARPAGDSWFSQLLLQFGNPVKQAAFFFDKLGWYIGAEHILCLAFFYETQMLARLVALTSNRKPVLFGN